MEQVLMRDAQRWVAPQASWLVAREGDIWVTRSGDLDDHMLARGERLALARGDDVVVEALRRDMPAVWDWQPRAASAYGLRRELLAWGSARTARALRGAAVFFEGLAAQARSAAARACRAQGCINMGDSMASAGTLQ
jgi:hypothetical protein